MCFNICICAHIRTPHNILEYRMKYPAILENLDGNQQRQRKGKKKRVCSSMCLFACALNAEVELCTCSTSHSNSLKWCWPLLTIHVVCCGLNLSGL